MGKKKLLLFGFLFMMVICLVNPACAAEGTVTEEENAVTDTEEVSHETENAVDETKSEETEKTEEKSSVYTVKNKAPVIQKFTMTATYVRIYWNVGADCVKNIVYRKTANGTYKKLATLNSDVTTYTDKNVKTGVKYCYKIVNQTSNQTYSSAVKGVTPVKIKSPKLNWLKSYSVGEKKYAKICWDSVSGDTYYIYKKNSDGTYTKVGTTKATSSQCSYTVSVTGSGESTYTVRGERKVGEMAYKLSSYDSEGITTLNKKPDVDATFTNLNAKVNWKRVSGADGYFVYRKYKLDGDYRKIATISGGSNVSYKDIYHNTMTKASEKELMIAGYYVDPSINGLVYTVRAYKNVNGKITYSDYYRNPAFYLETPTIVDVTKTSATKARVEWSTIKNAQKYYIYTGYINSDKQLRWKKVATVDGASTTRQIAEVTVDESHTYVTVKAVSEKKEKTVYSGYDKGFKISNRNYSNKNILYIGDSITFGSPYKGKTTVEVFSYPWRINQLTGAKFYNPSIPGATYSYKKSDSSGYHRYRLVTDVAQKIQEGKTPEQALHSNTQTYKDFDVIVMAAGTNDYLDDTRIGSKNSTNISEFNGAINQIMSWIKAGNKQRIAAGKKPIKVVFVDLFYSDRTYHYDKLTDRRVQKNRIGLTLTDYQNAIDQLVKKYRSEGMEIYQFETENIVTSANCPIATSDNLHMTRYTYGQIGNQLAEFMIKNKIL